MLLFNFSAFACFCNCFFVLDANWNLNFISNDIRSITRASTAAPASQSVQQQFCARLLSTAHTMRQTVAKILKK